MTKENSIMAARPHSSEIDISPNPIVPPEQQHQYVHSDSDEEAPKANGWFRPAHVSRAGLQSCVHDLFDARTRESPLAICCACPAHAYRDEGPTIPGYTLTYADLKTKSLHIAAALLRTLHHGGVGGATRKQKLHRPPHDASNAKLPCPSGKEQSSASGGGPTSSEQEQTDESEPPSWVHWATQQAGLPPNSIVEGDEEHPPPESSSVDGISSTTSATAHSGEAGVKPDESLPDVHCIIGLKLPRTSEWFLPAFIAVSRVLGTAAFYLEAPDPSSLSAKERQAHAKRNAQIDGIVDFVLDEEFCREAGPVCRLHESERSSFSRNEGNSTVAAKTLVDKFYIACSANLDFPHYPERRPPVAIMFTGGTVKEKIAAVTHWSHGIGLIITPQKFLG